MQRKKFIAIGHIVNDTEPTDHIGGGVVYAAMAAKALGYETHVITKCAPQHPYILELTKQGITVHLLPTSKNTITTFKNSYDLNGKRKQQVSETQDIISLRDETFLPKEVLQSAIILVAPVIGEVSLDLFPYFAKLGFLAVTPQGYFRQIDIQGNVTHKPWQGFESYLPFVEVTIFSEEDISLHGKISYELLERINKESKMTLLTQGAQGATVFEPNKIPKIITTFSLKSEEIKDYTGAGDTFAAAFLSDYTTQGDIKKSVQFACYYATVKLVGLGGIGIDAVPTKKQFLDFLEKRKITL